ncbi:T9SS type A sorting domain-containing protein [bacterium]|nr:T9SS type A sorting domain-containing protein [bacterium]
MKSILLFFSFYYLITAAIAQCGHDVITNPDSPQNTSIPNNPEFLNAFKWSPGGLQDGIQLTNMQYSQYMLHIMSPQQPQYYNYIYNGEPPTPENGWELLLLNTGTYPDLTDLPNGGHSDIPYVVLYNRYSGLMRVFANYGDGYLPSGISFDAVKVILKFDGNEERVNGNLRLLNGIDQALDQPTEVIETVSIAKHPNSPGKWFVADFQMTYDPCVCYFPSRFRLNFEFIESESIELHGREISVEQNIINGTAVKTKDYLSNFDYTGNTASGGVAMYRTLEKMVDDFEAKLIKYKVDLALVNEHNAKVERNLAVINLFRQVIINGGNSTIDAVSNMPWFNNAVTFANDLLGDTLVKKKEIVKAAKDAFGKEFNTYISENFKKKSKPTNPVRPVATFSEMHFSGVLLNSTNIAGPNFYTPGTYGTPGTMSTSPLPLADDPLGYPIYNERLGSFALLKSPKIKMSRAISQFNEELSTKWLQDNSYYWHLYGQKYSSWVRTYQIKLSEDLVYSFNQTLDIKSIEIKAAFVIKAKPTITSPIDGVLNARVYGPKSANVFSTNRNLKLNAWIKKHTTNFGFGSYFPQFFIDYNQPLTVDFDPVLYETSFFPIDAFFNNSYAMALENEHVSEVSITSPLPDPWGSCDNYPQQNGSGDWCFPTPEQVGHIDPPSFSIVNSGYMFDFDITLKLIVDIEFETIKSDGTANTITQIYSYPIDESNVDFSSGFDLTSNLPGSAMDINQYPENISLNDINFDGSIVPNCERNINTQTYTCQAWNDISIDGELTTSNGYSVNILAGNEIIELPDAIVSPEIVRSIKPVLDYSHPMPEADEIVVTSFCGTTNQAGDYLAGKPSGKILTMIEEQEIANASWNFDLFPNPTRSKSLIRVNSTSVLPVSISVTDITGKSVSVKVTENGINIHSIDLSNCQKGIYFVAVMSYGGLKTKQIIVQ